MKHSIIFIIFSFILITDLKRVTCKRSRKKIAAIMITATLITNGEQVHTGALN